MDNYCRIFLRVLLCNFLTSHLTTTLSTLELRKLSACMPSHLIDILLVLLFWLLHLESPFLPWKVNFKGYLIYEDLLISLLLRVTCCYRAVQNILCDLLMALTISHLFYSFLYLLNYKSFWIRKHTPLCLAIVSCLIDYLHNRLKVQILSVD